MLWVFFQSPRNLPRFQSCPSWARGTFGGSTHPFLVDRDFPYPIHTPRGHPILLSPNLPLIDSNSNGLSPLFQSASLSPSLMEDSNISSPTRPAAYSGSKSFVAIVSNPPSDGLPNGSVLSEASRYNEVPHKLLGWSQSPRRHRVSRESHHKGFSKIYIHLNAYTHQDRGFADPVKTTGLKWVGLKFIRWGSFESSHFL